MRLESDGQPVGGAKLVVITFRTVISGEMLLLTQSRQEQDRVCPDVIAFLFETWLILAGSTDTAILAGTQVIRVHGLCMRP